MTYYEPLKKLRRSFGDNTVVLLLLILFDKNTTAKEAAKIIGVSEGVSDELVKELIKPKYKIKITYRIPVK